MLQVAGWLISFSLGPMQRTFAVILIATALALRVSADADLRGAIFRSDTDAVRLKVVSDSELQFTPERAGPNLVCKYSRDGNSLRVIATLLGSPQAIYFKIIPEGLQRADGTVLYDAAHFDAAAKVAAAVAAQRQRELDAALASLRTPTPSATAPTLSISSAKAFAVYAPKPDYPFEARSRHLTGSGVAVLVVDSASGNVTDAFMAQSMGSPILDNAVLSAFRRWRFKPGSVGNVKVPIAFTMTGASY